MAFGREENTGVGWRPHFWPNACGQKNHKGRSSPSRIPRERVIPKSKESNQSDLHARFSRARMQ